MLGALSLERMLALFASAQCVHIVRWRCGKPPGYLFWFLRLWLILPTVCVAVWLTSAALFPGEIDWNDTINWVGALIGYVALCGAYVMIYPAISELSPSLEILRDLRNSPARALPISELKIVEVGGVDGFLHRLVNLQNSRLITTKGDVLQVTLAGLRIAAVLNAYRRVLGIKPGVGG